MRKNPCIRGVDIALFSFLAFGYTAAPLNSGASKMEANINSGIRKGTMSNMNDREFTKYFIWMIAVLVLLTVVIYILANSIVGDSKANKSVSSDNTAIAKRIQPVGQVNIATKVLNVVMPVAQAADGAATYNASCAACHNTGVAGAPKIGDKAGWKARIAQGNKTLYSRAVKGYKGKKGFMPAKGGNVSLSDGVVKAAVDYMVSQSK